MSRLLSLHQLPDGTTLVSVETGAGLFDGGTFALATGKPEQIRQILGDWIEVLEQALTLACDHGPADKPTRTNLFLPGIAAVAEPDHSQRVAFFPPGKEGHGPSS